MIISPTRRFRKTALLLAISAFYTQSALAQTPPTDEDLTTLDAIKVEVMLPDEKNYAVQQATSLLKTDTTLFETARSVNVVTQELIQQKQATSVSEALDGVAGISANPYGRRGFDDFIIRGQVSSDQIFVDGLRLTSSIFSSVELAGTDTVQVLKGPSSVEFGAGAVGGAVNLTTKRPQAENFYRAGLSYGSYQNISGTFDINHVKNENSDKGAFRIVGRVGDKNDPVEHVYFKNYYISPSYNFDLGDKTDLSVVASYQYREFVRQQGLPVYGTLEKNPKATYSENRFTSEPHYPYQYNVYRLGYNLAHHFDNGWDFKQNFAFNYINQDADVVLVQGTARQMFNDNGTDGNFIKLKRQYNQQDRVVKNYALDNSLHGEINTTNTNHKISVGVDAYLEDNVYHRVIRSIDALDLNNPKYGAKAGNTSTRDNIDDTKSHFVGLYAKDQIKWNHFLLSLAGRYDWVTTDKQMLDNKTNTTKADKNSDHAFSGSASILYNWNDTIAPYASYATSFIPVTETGENQQILDPEKGQQYEIGVKFQGFNNRLQGSLSAYELTRKNVPTATLDNADIYESIGKQVTRGAELEITADLFDQWNLALAYSYIPYAKIVEDKEAKRQGLPIDHVPKHSANLMTRYYFEPSKLGWYVGGGVRYEGDHIAQRPHRTPSQSTYAHLPSYTLFDLQTGYKAQRWGANFSVKNVFDEHYYSGTTPNGALVTTGMPRTFNLGLTYNF